MAEVRLQAVSKHYERAQGRRSIFKARPDSASFSALERLSLEINDKELFTILGPSGSGKSTLLNLIAGLDTPSEGKVLFDGIDVTALDPAARNIAMVFQSYALYPHLTVFGNIAFPLQNRKLPKEQIATEVADIAERLGLSSLLQSKPRQLSGGQRQRVALARALVRRPAVFLLDEPLSNLDVHLRLAMRAELKRIHQEYQVTIVYVTHDQEEAMVLSDRIAILQDGALQQHGTPESLFRDPANRFVAEFLGTPPMNFLTPPHHPPLPQDPVTLGIRPSDLIALPAPDPARAQLILPATISTVENLGTDLWILAAFNSTPLRARWQSPDAPRPNSPVYLHATYLHRFPT